MEFVWPGARHATGISICELVWDLQEFFFVFLVAFEPAGILASSWTSTSRDIGFHLLANVKCIQWWQVLLCHWRELSQVPFLSQQKFCHDKYVFVTTNVCSSRQNMSFVVTKVCLSQQKFRHDNMFCCDISLLQQAYLCQDKRHVLSWQTHVCHDKSMLVVTKLYLSWRKLCCNKHNFVMTKLFSQQACFFRNKNDTCGSHQW